MPDELANEGGGTPSGRRPRHVSAKDKSAAVLRVIRGEHAGALAEEIGVSVGRLEQWLTRYQAAGLEALEKKTHQKTLYQKITANTKTIRAWAAVLMALLITVLLLVRFLNREPVN